MRWIFAILFSLLAATFYGCITIYEGKKPRRAQKKHSQKMEQTAVMQVDSVFLLHQKRYQ
jgi:hypothetical protein